MESSLSKEILYRISFILFLSLCFMGFSKSYEQRDFFFYIIYIGVYLQYMLFTPYFILVFNHRKITSTLITILTIIIYLFSFNIVSKYLYFSMILSSVYFYTSCIFIIHKRKLVFEEKNQLIPIKLIISQNVFLKNMIIAISIGLLFLFIINFYQ